MNDYFKEFLSENEQHALVQFNGSEVMREAVKKVLLAGLYRNGTLRQNDASDALRNAAFGLVASGREYTDQEIGQDLKALWQGINALEMAFNEIAKFLPEPPKVEKKNNAR